MSEYEKIELKKMEKIITSNFTVYSIVIILIAIAAGWPVWQLPVICAGMSVVWMIYIKQSRSYDFRACVMAVLMLFEFALYSYHSDSFAGSLCVYAALVMLLAIYNRQKIMYLEMSFFVLMVLYYAFVRHEIPFATLSDKIRSMMQIGSVISVQIVAYNLVKEHRMVNRQLYQKIEELWEAERSKSDFLANMSHEIRTPINTVCGMSEMILRERISDTVREDTFNIQAAGRNLLSIVSDVLDFSELEAGTMELVEEPYNLTSTINDVINMAIAQKSEKNLELIVDCDAKIPYSLLGDEQKIRRVILSFVNNAIKFTEAGCITLSVSSRQEEYGINLCVKVKDTGIGIAQENLEKLFTGFSQVDTRRNRQESGIGIGLAIAKQIITKMGGFINVQSELGKGSEFQFVIPQKVVDERPMVEVKNPETMNILLYINAEKFEFTEIRDDYMRSIQHMMDSLEVRSRSCRNLQEVKRRVEKEIFTHIFIAVDEYEEDREYFDALSHQLSIAVIQDREQAIVPGGKIRSVYKPFYVLSIASVLSGEHVSQRLDGSHYTEKRFVAPEACVLVVDDNLMNLKVVEGLLRPYKIKVFVATSGREALEKLDGMRYDFIFMDHMMPEMDGVETAHKIRNKPGMYYQNVPIIALTANAIGGAREMFLAEGFQDYVAKPIELSHLERVLRKYIPQEKIIKLEHPEEYTESEPETQETLFKSAVSLLDRASGLRYCGGDEKDYQDILDIYLSTGLHNFHELERLYREQDWKNYTIMVHSLKSTSISIGAKQLGELAKNQEAAGKTENISYLTAHHEELRMMYGSLLSEIGGETVRKQLAGEVLAAKSEADMVIGTVEQELNMAEFETKLKELAVLLDTFEKDTVEEKLKELFEYQYHGSSLRILLQPVCDAVEQFDFYSASETVTRMLEEGGPDYV